MTHAESSIGNWGDEISSPEDVKRDRSSCDSASLPVARSTARNSQPSTRVSLLVEALVRSVVTAYETDRNRAARAYSKICRRLFQMGLIDESWAMTELEGARVQFEHALFQLLNSGSVRSSSSPLLLQDAYFTSQYSREFDEFEKIGGGAYGKVFRVKNKLDGTEYAVKKIPIHSDGLDSVKKYLSEVKTFASLNHPNIVQYKAAWLELGSPSEIKAIASSSWDQPKSTVPHAQNQVEQFIFHRDVNVSMLSNSSGKNSSNFEVEFEGSSPSKKDNSISLKGKIYSPSKKTDAFNFCRNISSTSLDDRVNSFEIAFEQSSGDNLSKENSISTNKSPSEGKVIVPTTQNGVSKPKLRWATLYIQMALCHGTLDQWLRHRNDTFNAEVAIIPSGAQALRTKAINQILIQILRGLKYIHSRGVVHHDIKPSNIFVSAEGGSLLVQLGDFGLACPLQRARHGFAKGTPLYAAPEQLAGRCDPKSDMYSVGIVLFELLEDFSTQMERTRRISELRARSDHPIPPDFSLVNLVPALVRRRALERPDASTLLRALERTEGSSVEALEERLEEKEREIRRLKDLLREHGVQSI